MFLLSPQHQAVWQEGGCGCRVGHCAWRQVRASVQRSCEAPGGFLGGYLLRWLRMEWGEDVCCCFLLSLWQTGHIQPTACWTQKQAMYLDDQSAGMAVGHSMAWLILSQVCCFALSQHRAWSEFWGCLGHDWYLQAPSPPPARSSHPWACPINGTSPCCSGNKTEPFPRGPWLLAGLPTLWPCH